MIKFRIYSKTNLLILLIIGMGILSGCAKSGFEEVVVYDNLFKSGSTEKLTGAILYKSNKEYLIGRYNNGGFTLNLEKLPKHKAIQIIIEPLFHDSWDGNNNYGGIDGPDIWSLTVDGVELVYSSFSNTPCNTLYCLFQSFPARYGIVNNPPKTDAAYDLPGFCHRVDVFGTSGYKMVKTIQHTKDNAIIDIRDFLVQQNAVNKLCDESWSIANLTVKVINTAD